MRTIDQELTRTGREIRDVADRRRLPPLPRRPGRPAVRAATAVATAVVLIAVIAVPALLWRSSPTTTISSDVASGLLVGSGSWETMAEAPIPTRPHAVTAWIGTEALFWAGSSLDRGFAYSDGAAYDPTTDTWHSIPVPGWGHPGLTGVFADGQLYALAKGGGVRFDPADGTWTDLPPVEGMLLAAAVAVDDTVFGLGPTTVNPDGQTDTAIARYNPGTNDWAYGPVYEGTPETGSLFQDTIFLDQPVLWTGAEIVLWNPEGGGTGYNPTTQTWRQIPAPPTESGTITTSKATIVDTELVVVAQTNGTDNIALARHQNSAWTWKDLNVNITDLNQATIAAAGDWLIIFTPERDPIIIHPSTGDTTEDHIGPLAGLQAPNTVWTGRNLIIWGGIPTPTESNPNPAPGAIWTPPNP